MTEHDGKPGRPPTQADVGRLLTLRNDRGAMFRGVLQGLTVSGAAVILCFGTDYGGDWRTYRKPEHATVTGAEVLDDA